MTRIISDRRRWTLTLAVLAVGLLVAALVAMGNRPALGVAPPEVGDPSSHTATIDPLSAGGLHTCALLEGGTVRCWGASGAGQLGYGDTNKIGDDEHPSSSGNVAVGGTVVQLAVGDYHTGALLKAATDQPWNPFPQPRTVRCWGLGWMGQLG